MSRKWGNYEKEKNIKRIGVIATAGTIKSEGWKKQIEKNIPDAKLVNRACPLLASMAEEGWTDNEIAKLAIHEYLKDHGTDPELLKAMEGYMEQYCVL